MKFSISTKNISINFDTKYIEKRFEKAQKKLVESVKKDTEEFVPADSLALTNTAIIRGTDEIVYTKPYAHYQYMGLVRTDELGRTFVGKGETKPILTSRPLKYQTHIHPFAGSHWGEKSLRKNKDKWTKEVAEVIKNG